ncbi:hypothetical protein [Negadavirga shengliensis]|uniref:RNA polymerase sigma-70 region 2 domain-containing protein n=1 Tax=Negadavirga shengliensis TaxID=1389218 RepID=A0ABV9T5Z3_9BACT
MVVILVSCRLSLFYILEYFFDFVKNIFSPAYIDIALLKMSEEFLEEVSNQDWKSLGKRMKGMAVHWLKHTFGESNPKLPMGYKIEDITQDALRRAMIKDWKEKFNQKRFENYLFGAIRSIVSNLADLSDNKEVDREFFNKEQQSDDGEKTRLIDQMPETDGSDIYNKIDKEIAFDKLELEIDGEKDLESVLTAMRLGMQPKEIAEELEKEPKEIYKLQRQLFSRAQKIGKSLHYEK